MNATRPSGGPRQLALALDHAESFAREDFLEGPSNASALALLSRWPDWPDRAVVLIGPEGAGKSHLAAIWAAESGARFIAARALGEADLPTELATGALVVEDLVDGQFDERALFHLLNMTREQSAYLLLTARVAPALFDLTIRDLASRLRVLPVVTLSEPDDAMLRAVIVKLCADRQMAIDNALLDFIVTRIERSVPAARDAVALLDHEALRLKRPLTRTLAAEVLKAPDSDDT